MVETKDNALRCRLIEMGDAFVIECDSNEVRDKAVKIIDEKGITIKTKAKKG